MGHHKIYQQAKLLNSMTLKIMISKNKNLLNKLVQIKTLRENKTCIMIFLFRKIQ
jgi:hypothetical protein